MKKIILTLCALATIVACTKSENVYDAPQEIAFNPVSQKATKAPVQGTTFPTGYDITTFGYYKVGVAASTTLADFKSNSETATEYIPGAAFKFQSGATWHGDPTPYYWPKEGSIVFAGYANAVSDLTHSLTGNFSATDYTQSAVNDDTAKDLLFFDLTSQSYSDGPVSVVFKHAMSWLTFQVKAGDANSAANFLIKKIVLKNVIKKASLTTSENVPVWTKSADATDKADITVFESTNGVAPTTTAALAQGGEDKVVIIPQNATSVAITYIMTDGTNADGSIKWTPEQTTVKDLSGLGAEKWNDTTEHNTWNYASHYTYIFNFGLKEITLAPTVTDWTEYTYDSLAI